MHNFPIIVLCVLMCFDPVLLLRFLQEQFSANSEYILVVVDYIIIIIYSTITVIIFYNSLARKYVVQTGSTGRGSMF